MKCSLYELLKFLPAGEWFWGRPGGVGDFGAFVHQTRDSLEDRPYTSIQFERSSSRASAPLSNRRFHSRTGVRTPVTAVISLQLDFIALFDSERCSVPSCMIVGVGNGPESERLKVLVVRAVIIQR